MPICNDIDLIFPNFYIGNSRAAREYDILKQYSITTVVNVARDLNDPCFSGITTIKFGLIDGLSGDNKLSTVIVAVQTILTLLSNGETVLLHCHEGISRSGAIGLLVIMCEQGLLPRQAEDYLCEKRPIIYINKGLRSLINDAYWKLPTPRLKYVD